LEINIHLQVGFREVSGKLRFFSYVRLSSNERGKEKPKSLGTRLVSATDRSVPGEFPERVRANEHLATGQRWQRFNSFQNQVPTQWPTLALTQLGPDRVHPGANGEPRNSVRNEFPRVADVGKTALPQ